MPFNAKLQCSFCSRTFTDFGPLGAHVQRAHPEIGGALRAGALDNQDEAASRQIVPKTKRGHASPASEAISGSGAERSFEDKVSRAVTFQIQQIEQEVAKMAKEELLPQPEQGQDGDYNPWLTVEALGRSGKGSMTLLGNVRPSTSQFGKGIIVDVRLNGDDYSWTIKYSSGNYQRMFKRFGKDVKKWRGKVDVETKQYMGKDYIAVS